MALAQFSPNTLHLVIDMQRLFAEETDWHTPVITDILPNVLRLCEAGEGRTIFVRFMVPDTIDWAQGRWKTYYRRWATIASEAPGSGLLDLVAPLAALADDRSTVEKYTYSVFGAPGFTERLRAEGIDTLVFSGVETDVCIYASVLAAIDQGFRVVIATDAVGSSDVAAHEATMNILAPRLSEQLEMAPTQAILDAWDC
ncbi:MAG: isochorismatase family cysteine hydrolase [Pararhizobium sp.]